MSRAIKKGTADQSTVIRIVDSGDGTPEESVEHNSSGIALWYRREGATKTAITPAALSALNDAHSDGGIEHIDDGYYRLDLPDAACATGANGVMVGGTVTGMVVIGAYHPLVDYDPQDTVRLGLTALPNAAAEAAGGLYTRGTGAGQINQDSNGRIDVNQAAISGDSTAADNAESFFDGTGYGAVLQRTTIATLASQTSFTLTAGSADNDAYNGCIAVIQDASTAAQKCIGIVKDYTGASKTVTLLVDPGVFTMASSDVITILAPDLIGRYIAAAAAGVASGAGTGTEVFKDIDGTTTRITATVDSSGNRSGITYG